MASSYPLYPEQPALAAPAVDLPAAGPGQTTWAYEPKWDGWRALVGRVDGRVRILSRRGTDLTSGFPDIAAAAAEQLEFGDVIDGELVIWRDGRIDFTALAARRAVARKAAAAAAREPATLMVFDVVSRASVNLQRTPLHYRRQVLEDLAGGWAPPIQLTPQTTSLEVARGWMDDFKAADAGVEGIVAKPLWSRYRPGRRDWLKIRIRNTREALVGGITAAGRRSGTGAPALTSASRLVLGLPETDGQLRVAGTTLPLTTAQRDALGPLLRPPARAPHPWPADLAVHAGGFAGDPSPVELVDPIVVVEVDADTAFDHGRWRHSPRLVRARPDLSRDDLTDTSGS